MEEYGQRMQSTNGKGLNWGKGEYYGNSFREGQAGRELQLHSGCQEEEAEQR